MDRDVYEAAVEGSVTTLQYLLQQDALVLDRFMAGCHAETPLHIASLLGHAGFVKEILSRKPELARELDARKSLPLHLATAKGYLDIVKMLVAVNPEACLVCDRDGRNPLHIAAIKGHVSVLRELVRIRPDAARMILIDQGETILHLCVRYNQLQAMELLIELMHDDGLVNSKDGDGNTLLHVAVSEKQIEAIKILTTCTGIEVNVLNAYGFTALDLSTQSRKDAKDWEIWELLRRFGAVNAKDIHSSVEFRTNEMVRTFTAHGNHPTNALQPQNKGFGNGLDMQNDWVEKMRSALMVVASLIATMAYQMGANPPGGLWQGDSEDDTKANQMGANPPNSGWHGISPSTGQNIFSYNYPHSHSAGQSILSDKYPSEYKEFLALNTTGFLASLSIILLLISGLPIRQRIFMWILMVVMWIAVTAVAFTYMLCMYAISVDSLGRDASFEVVPFIILFWFGLVGILLLWHTIRLIMKIVKYFKKSKTQ